MKLVGMMPVRNEDWCLGLSLRVALMWCDEVVVLLHACTDQSADKVNDIKRENEPGRVIVRRLGHEIWDEMEHRQRMMETARKRGATHLAIIDADEVLTGNLTAWGLWSENDSLERLGDGILWELPGYNIRNGINQYHSNGVWGNRWFSTAFADAPDLGWSGDRFHHREPGPRKLTPYRPIQQGQGGVMHLWGASERRLIAKHALYKVSERLRWPEKSVSEIEVMYSWAIHGDANVRGAVAYGNPRTWTYSPVPESWWQPYQPFMKYLDVDAVPYQEEEVRRLVAEHGKERFSGLDLFGLV